MIQFEIKGRPQAKQRPRFSRGHTYTPKETVKFEKYVKECFEESKYEMLSGTLKATLTFIYEVPKSKSKSIKNDMLNHVIRPTQRPDLDNLAKSILDSLNGLAYEDDSQIVELNCTKYYGLEAKTIVSIKML